MQKYFIGLITTQFKPESHPHITTSLETSIRHTSYKCQCKDVKTILVYIKYLPDAEYLIFWPMIKAFLNMLAGFHINSIAYNKS